MNRKRSYSPRPNRKAKYLASKPMLAEKYVRAPGGFGAGNVQRNALAPIDETTKEYLHDEQEPPRKTITLSCGYVYDQQSGSLYLNGSKTK